MSWTAIQLGSREHYSIPISLYEVGHLDKCITDTWLSEFASNLVKLSLPSLASRRNSQLPDCKVTSVSIRRLIFDSMLSVRRMSRKEIIFNRNKWFSQWAAKKSEELGSTTIFSYSYTARYPFSAARARGARCILGQIDPGPLEEEVVFEASKNYYHLAYSDDGWSRQYWNLWNEEVAMAHKVIVNSSWSAELLKKSGVPSSKIVEVPLVYSPTTKGTFALPFGETISHHDAECVLRLPNKRLKALFLGSVILRKGVGQLFDAMRLLSNEPVDFTVVGPIGVKIPDEISSMANVRFLGSVDKETAKGLYQTSDMFLFPTLSDGFGLTQLEALGHGLPVISSRNCALVIEDRVNGLLLNEVSPESIAEAIMELVRDPALLARLKSNSGIPDKYNPRHLATSLLSLEKG